MSAFSCWLIQYLFFRAGIQDPLESQKPKEFFFCISFSKTDSGLWVYNIFCSILSSYIVSLVCNCLLVFSFHCVLVYFSFLKIFVCFPSFFILPSKFISHPGFVFLFGFLVGRCQFYHGQILIQHELNRLVRWCRWDIFIYLFGFYRDFFSALIL